MKRRALLVAVTLGLAGGRAVATEDAPVDADFLEFLGSMEGDDESFDRYLAARERTPRGTTSDEARVRPAEHDDADIR
jgi:hypothetical protein